MMASVSLQSLVKSYGNALYAVKGIDLEIKDKEFVVLIGPSGCGKTTTLRMVAGLESISGGDILIGGKVVNDVHARDRDIAMVFQNYALYPHMSVFENIAFGLQVRKHKKADIEIKVKNAAQILGIGDYLHRKPKELSGGQRQRVAMGRAIVRDPQVFLFDEPLSNLDAKLREKMRTEIKRIHQSVQATTIYVTHDQVEAMTLADRIVMMNHGKIEQIGTPDDLYYRPASQFVAGFIGNPQMNFFECQVEGNNAEVQLHLATGITLSLPAGLRARCLAYKGEKIILGIRPENLCLASPPTETKNGFSAIIEVVEPLGPDTLVYFRVGEVSACARVEPRAPVKVGEQACFTANMDQIYLFDRQSGLVI